MLHLLQLLCEQQPAAPLGRLAAGLSGVGLPPCSEAAIRAKIEERRRLEREKKKFAVRLEGSLAVERPPKVRMPERNAWQMCGAKPGSSCRRQLAHMHQLPLS